MNPHVRLLVGWWVYGMVRRMVCHNFLKGQEVTLPCSYRSSCSSRSWSTCQILAVLGSVEARSGASSAGISGATGFHSSPYGGFFFEIQQDHVLMSKECFRYLVRTMCNPLSLSWLLLSLPDNVHGVHCLYLIMSMASFVFT